MIAGLAEKVEEPKAEPKPEPEAEAEGSLSKTPPTQLTTSVDSYGALRVHLNT